MFDTVLKELMKHFDLVGAIPTNAYRDESIRRSKPLPPEGFETTFVVGLAYSKQIVKAPKDAFVPSFYCFGKDYHNVLKDKIREAMASTHVRYLSGVDNHPYDERLAATLSGLGFFGRHQLIINDTFGSYFFLGLVFADIPFMGDRPETVPFSCGDCHQCIEACPTGALMDNGYDRTRCLSFLNQAKIPLTQANANANYCLFGCDICQLACPKNIGKGVASHSEFALDDADLVKVEDLFSMTEKTFKAAYPKKAFLWKGKTVLMRNGILLLWRKRNHAYDPLISASLVDKPAWYLATAEAFLKDTEGNPLHEDSLRQSE